MSLVAKAELDLKTQKELKNYYCLLRHNKVLREDPTALETIHLIKEAFRNDDVPYAIQLWAEFDDNSRIALWVAESKGGMFSHKERKILGNR